MEKSKKIAILMALSTMLSGCKAKREEEQETIIPVLVEATTENIKTETTINESSIVSSAIESLQVSSSVSSYENSVISSAIESYEKEKTSCTEYTTTAIRTDDEEILGHFEEIGEEVKSEFNLDTFLQTSKKYFVYCVDFLFYDKEINNIKFSDLTDQAKQQLLSDIVTIDDLICSKFPNYKETISEGSKDIYQKAIELIRKGSKNIKEFSKDKLGNENYEKLKEFQKLFKETAFGDWDDFKNIIGKAKSKLLEGLK